MKPAGAGNWAANPGSLVTVARNVSTRYLVIIVDLVLGLVMLPFNLAHLGKEAYGLWMLLGSVLIHFSTLEFGYGSGLVKFVAQYRAHRDARALNEIASTLFVVFTGLAALAYAGVVVLAFNLQHIFALAPDQVTTARWILLIVGCYVACNFPFGVYGGIIGGFQRYDQNNKITIVVSLLVALTNAVVLLAGYGLVTLVTATTGVRMIAFVVYRQNAYRVFPSLRVHPSLFRRDRLREVTGFSIYAAVINWANKLNYQLDQLVIGMFLGSAAVAVWAPAARIIWGVQRLTNQLNAVLFPTIVDSDAAQQQRRLQEILLQGTRLSLVMVVPIATMLVVLADPLVRAWLGAQAEAVAECIPIIQILSLAVVVRVGSATGNTLLKGAGAHKFVAWVNLTTGVVNAMLSVVLIRRFGLIGVAWGTLVPITIAASLVLYPAACRRVGTSLWHATAKAVFPALWPGLVTGFVMMHVRDVISAGTLLAVALQAVAGGALYLVLFMGLAIGRQDRAYYLTKAGQLRRGGTVPAAVNA